MNKAKILYKDSSAKEIALQVNNKVTLLNEQTDIKSMSVNMKSVIWKTFGTLNFHKIFGQIGEIG